MPTDMNLLDLDQFKQHFRGFGLRDCAVRTRGIFYFVLFQDWDDNKPRPFDEELKTRVVPLFLNKEDHWSHSTLTGVGGLLAGACTLPQSQFVGVDGLGQVYAVGSGDDDFESEVPGGQGKGPARGGVRRIKQFGGWLYGAGGVRSMFKRIDRNQWMEIGPLPPEKKGEIGFDDFDLFSETDIYAAGGRGDVWHYDGRAWNRIAFPSNMWIESVCCGQDGFVYIGAQSGNVFRGRANQWKHIHQSDLSLPFKDMIWYGDRVYATNDYGLWEIQGETVAPSAQPIEITNCSGNLSVGDGVMLLAGAYGAALYDGKAWTRLFSLFELTKQVATP